MVRALLMLGFLGGVQGVGLGDVGSAECPSGDGTIDSPSLCRAAGAELGLHYNNGFTDDGSMPFGCIASVEHQGEFQFNNAHGGGNPQIRPICLKGVAPVMGSPVHVDMDKLTDFTAKFSVDSSTLVKNAQLPPDMAMSLPGFSLHGEVQADVGGERLKITLHGAGSMPNHPIAPNEPPYMVGAHEKGSAELIFDGPGGFVSYRGQADDKIPYTFGGDGGDRTPSIKGDFCIKVNFPKGLLPPGQQIKSQIVQMAPMIEQQLRMMPHADATVDGDQVAIYNSKEVSHGDGPPMYVGIKEKDGTPLGAGVVQPAGGTWTPFFRFTQWTHGAGDISEIQCTDGLDSSLAADRYAAVHMQVFDHVMASLKGAEALHPVFAAFPAKPSLIFKSSGNAATALEEKPVASSSLFQTVAVAVAAGTFGGLVVSFLAFLKGTSKANRVSLISDDA